VVAGDDVELAGLRMQSQGGASNSAPPERLFSSYSPSPPSWDSMSDDVP
jgi:hypothetical protein